MNNFRDKIRGLTGLHTALEGLLTTINQIPVNGGGSSGDDYSTDEKVIGTWIDGAPLYRKVCIVTGNGSNTVRVPTTDFDISICRVKSLSGYRVSKDNESVGRTVPFTSVSGVDGTVISSLSIGQDPYGLMVTDSKTNISTSEKFYLIVEYTKTTD